MEKYVKSRLLLASLIVCFYCFKDSSCIFGGFSWIQSAAASILFLPVFIVTYFSGKYLCYATYARKGNIVFRIAIVIFEVISPAISMISLSGSIGVGSHEAIFSCYNWSSWFLVAAVIIVLYDVDASLRKWLWKYRLLALQDQPENGNISDEIYFQLFGIVTVVNFLPYLIGFIYA